MEKSFGPSTVKTMDWFIRYADGSVYSSDQGPPHTAPRWGVLRVYKEDARVGVQYEPSDVGFWVWRFGTWIGLMEKSALWDYLGNNPGPCIVLMGITLPDENWMDFVKEEAEFLSKAQKSGWRKRELFRGSQVDL